MTTIFSSYGVEYTLFNDSKSRHWNRLAGIAAAQATAAATPPTNPVLTSALAEFASIYGRTIPTGYGTRPVNGACIWAGPLRKTVVGDVTTLVCSFAMSFGLASGASGLKARLARLDCDGTLIFDRSTGFKKPGVSFSLYTGNSDQFPDPTIEAVEGVGNVPGFRPLIYAVFRDFPLSALGFGKIPNMRALISEYGTDFNSWKEFERIPFPVLGDIETGVHSSLVDWKRRLFMSLDTTLLVDTDVEAEGGSLRVFDLDADQELTHSPIFDVFAPFGADLTIAGAPYVYAAIPDTQSVIVTPHDSGGGETLYDAQSFSGIQIAPNTINFAGYVDDWSGLVLLPSSGSIPNSQSYIWVDPLTGRVVNKMGSSIDILGFAAAMVRPDIALFHGDDVGQRVLLTASQIWLTCKLWIYNGDLLKQQGQIKKDSLNYRGNGNYEAVPGSGTLVGVVPNEPVEGASTNYFYVARGVAIHKLSAPNGRLVAEGSTILNSAAWSTVHTFGSPLTLKRLVMDVPNKELFAILDDGALSWVAKLSTYRNATAPNAEALLWLKQLPFRISYSLFPCQHNDQDYSTGLMMVKLTAAYKGAILANLDMATGSFELFVYQTTQAIDVDDSSLHSIDFDVPIVFDQKSFRLLQPEVPAWVDFDLATGDGKVPLADFLTWAGEEAGYPPANIQITGVTFDVWGSYIDRTTEFEPLLDDIATVYGLDWVQSEGLLKITLATVGGTGASIAAELTKADLAPLSEGEDGNTNLLTKHVAPEDIPSAVRITFLDKNLDYQANSVEAHRSKFPVQTVTGTGTLQVSIPIIDEVSQIYPLAYQALYRMAAESVTHEFRLSQRHYLLEPVDVITLELGTKFYKMKIASVIRNGDWSASYSAVSYSVSERPGISVDDDDFSTPDLPEFGISYSQLLFFDTPALISPEDEAQAINGLASFSTTTISRGQSYWNGARVTTNVTPTGVNDGAEALFYTAPTQPLWGKLRTALPVVTYPTIDHLTELKVYLYEGAFADFADITDDELLEGELNLALIGDGHEWELMSWENIADSGGGVVTLTNLHRCQAGTELAGRNRNPGDFFIPLSGALRSHFIGLDLLGETIRFKAYGLDELPTGGYVTQGTVTSGPDRPLAVVILHAVRDFGVTEDIELTWFRRDRVEEWDWLDGDEPDLPCSEASEDYELEIYDADGALVRTETALAVPSYTYTAADQLSDGFDTTETAFRVRVFQMSATVGRGWSRRYTLDVEI